MAEHPGKDLASKLSSETVRAAGGLVWRGWLFRRLLVVKRKRYGDWVLPKGKLLEGETWERGAVREVEEETGHSVSLGDFAGSVSYQVEGVPKLVRFWHMESTIEGAIGDTTEVELAAWMPIRKALRHLSYESERSLVRQYNGRGASGLAEGRLQSAIWTYRQELVARPPVPKAFEASMKALLDEAQLALQKGLLDQGWKAFQAAQRMEFWFMREEQLTTRLAVLRHETSQKLSGWRKEATATILGFKNASVRVQRVAGWEAQAILDQHSANQYYKVQLTQRYLKLLFPLAAIAVLAVAVLADFNAFPEDLLPGAGSSGLLAAMSVGLLGGTFSGLLSMTGNTTNHRIPEQISFLWVTLARCLVGATAGAAAFILVHAGIIPIDGNAPWAILATCFASGFSERLVVKQLEKT